MEKLAWIGKIVSITNIENADFIVSAIAICGRGGKWTGIVKKGEFDIDDKCIVFVQDAVLPDNEEFDFLGKNRRIKMKRLRGVPSECLIWPYSGSGEVGEDITSEWKVTKYERQLPASVTGIAEGLFPGNIPKTDEPNFQGVPELVQALYGFPYVVTVKADGTSMTAFIFNDKFGVCSRRLLLKDSPGNVQWRIAHEYKIEEKLRPSNFLAYLDTIGVSHNIALQMEICGPKIQGNPLGLKKYEPRLFSVYDIDKHEYLSFELQRGVANILDIPHIEVAEIGDNFQYDDEQLRILAEGTYLNGKQREGVVIRPVIERRVGNRRLSFKVINLLYRN